MKNRPEQLPEGTPRLSQLSFFNRQANVQSVVQPKLTVGASNDAHEHEADQTADRVMRKSEGELATPIASVSPIQRKESGAKGGFTAPPSVSRAISRSGQALEPAAKSFMETRFNRKFDGVQVHTDGEAANSARDISARAYTSGNHIVFGEGQYQPHTEGGRHLLAHELTHVVQQGVTKNKIQRDIKTYSKEKYDTMMSFDFSGGSSSALKTSAESQKLSTALSDLIKSGKISEVPSVNGNNVWFIANHHANVKLQEIIDALKTGNIPNYEKIAKAIYDIHAEYIVGQKSMIHYGLFGASESNFGTSVSRNNSRALTGYEINQATKVFKSALDYSKVTIEERSKVASVGGYARTIGNSIYFPDEIRDMGLLVHELTHVWQYQTTGWTYAHKALYAQVVSGYSFQIDGKSEHESLLEHRKLGKVLTDFNKEQQGDILESYFRRLQKNEDISAFKPFVDDIIKP
jgi:hypothetical protein